MLKRAFAQGHQPTAETLIRAYDRMLRAAPVGITVVAPNGHVLVINEQQTALAGCPWVSDPRINLLTHPQVPEPIRSGLAHVYHRRAYDTAIRLLPFRFGEHLPVIDTWIVGIAEGGTVLGAALLQHEAEGEDLAQPNGLTPTETEAPEVVVPPALDIDRLIQRYRLTERELQVVQGLCRGAGTGEIATQMAISPHTVKDYIKRIQRKMGVKTRMNIAIHALTLSLTR